MSNVENHMDDLFKRAADDYPLKNSVGDWDSLLPVLAAEVPVVATAVGKKKNRNFFYILFSLFVASGIAVPLIINDPFQKVTSKNSLAEKEIADKNIIDENRIIENKNNPGITLAKPSNNTSSAKTKIDYSKPKYEGVISGKPMIAKSELQNKNEPIKIADEDKKSQYSLFESSGRVEAVEKIETEISLSNFDISFTENESTIKEIGESKMSDTAVKARRKNKTKFYFGLSAGIEQSNIKNQGNTKPGLNAGLVAGLQINKQLAIETGIQVTQKKYYTEGKYFQPKQGSMPSNMTVESLYGTSTLLEIPVNIKFNFSKKINTFYTSAGFSSYLMTSERNKYNAVVGGQQQQINSTYHSMDKYITSMINFSFGYQHALQKNINIRVEPFIQIPLRGLGIGSLPVTSRGIHLVISQRKK